MSVVLLITRVAPHACKHLFLWISYLRYGYSSHMTQAPLEVWQSSDEVCHFGACMNGNEEFAQHVLPSLPAETVCWSPVERCRWTGCFSCVWDEELVMEGCTGWWAGGQAHVVWPTNKHEDLHSAEGHGCRVRTGTMQIALTLYHGYHDNPFHLKLGVSPTRCRSGEEGQESCVRVSWFYSLACPLCTSLLHTSAEAGFKKLEVKIPAQDFLIALPPSPKAFIYLKAPPVPSLAPPRHMLHL